MVMATMVVLANRELQNVDQRSQAGLKRTAKNICYFIKLYENSSKTSRNSLVYCKNKEPRPKPTVNKARNDIKKANKCQVYKL